MVTLTFVFDKDNVEKAGYTEDELLQPMRAHAQKYHIPETQYGVFSKDGEHALAELTMFIPRITREQLTFNIDTNIAKDILGEKNYTTVYSNIKTYMKNVG